MYTNQDKVINNGRTEQNISCTRMAQCYAMCLFKSTNQSIDTI